MPPGQQAIEFLTALRGVGKKAYWFIDNGAKHGLEGRTHRCRICNTARAP